MNNAQYVEKNVEVSFIQVKGNEKGFYKGFINVGHLKKSNIVIFFR